MKDSVHREGECGQGVEKACQCISEEPAMVSTPYAVVDPRAVVIVARNASVANVTVPRSRHPNDLALRA